MKSIICNMTKRKLRICIIALDGLVKTVLDDDDFVSKLSTEFVLLHNRLEEENDDD